MWMRNAILDVVARAGIRRFTPIQPVPAQLFTAPVERKTFGNLDTGNSTVPLRAKLKQARLFQ
jgi:hypothetical protein